jgi:hypothetical protein
MTCKGKTLQIFIKSHRSTRLESSRCARLQLVIGPEQSPHRAQKLKLAYRTTRALKRGVDKLPRE